MLVASQARINLIRFVAEYDVGYATFSVALTRVPASWD